MAREGIEDIENAWRRAPEFTNAFHFAIRFEDTKPLKDYLCSAKPLTLRDRRDLVSFITLLEQRIASQKHPRGRPRRNPASVAAAEQAERNAAWLVAFMKEEWGKQHGKQRVPSAAVDAMVKTAIAEAAKVFGVPESVINANNVRRALKTGRVAVRSS